MTVRELIEILEELPPDYPVISDDSEITEVLIRDEVYYSEEGIYKDSAFVKLC